jgi:uncharacterized protein (TIGR02246 family)
MDARQATTAILEAWERGDADAVARLFAEDGRYEDPLFPEPVVGPEAIREALVPAMAEIRDVQIPVKALAVSGDGVAICEASFLSKLTSGEGRLDFDFAMAVEMRNGLVARLSEYFDARGIAP